MAAAAKPTPSFWRGKRVLLTGHTGFKGSWLALWLARTQDIYQPLQLWQRLERPDGRQLGHFLRLGVP